MQPGYDPVAGAYLATKERDEPVALAALEKLAGTLSPGVVVLDLGCGASDSFSLVRYQVGVEACRAVSESLATTLPELKSGSWVRSRCGLAGTTGSRRSDGEE